MAARTKTDKGDAIAAIVDTIKTENPSGGFIKKDPSTGRWHRITDSEARDKVGHAIRKAVQRLEEAKPKHAARLRKDHEKIILEGGKNAIPTRRARGTITASETPSGNKSSPAPQLRESSGHDQSTPADSESETMSKTRALTRSQNDAILPPSIHGLVPSQHATSALPISQTPASSDNVWLQTSSGLRGLSSAVNPFPGGSGHMFPSRSAYQPRHTDLSILPSLLSPFGGLLRATTPLHLNPGSNQSFARPISVAQGSQPSDELWLTAAALRQQHGKEQQAIQRLRELEYVRQLAGTAAGNYGSSFQVTKSAEMDDHSRQASGLEAKALQRFQEMEYARRLVAEATGGLARSSLPVVAQPPQPDQRPSEVEEPQVKKPAKKSKRKHEL